MWHLRVACLKNKQHDEEVAKRTEQGVLKQLRINWNPNNKLLAPHFIKMLCFSTTALQSRPKQKAKSAIHRFCFFDDFLLSRDLQVDVHLRKIDQISAALSVNFVWGARPQSPCYFEGGVSRPFKTKIQTAPDDIFLLTFA